jgi:DNA-directed RNA polymerase subunit RPC12/RpoP
MAKKKEVFEEEEEEVTCPVCGKPVGLNVPSCVHCGAEFEEVEAEEGTPAKEAHEEEGETAECPVCGKSVSLDITSCPYCGAEFEEEEVEEVIEVEEKVVPVKSKPARKIPAVEEAPAADAEEEALAEIQAPSNITDLRVIGVALIILGILGSQIAFMVDWYWTWVPPIESNLGMFVAIPAVIIVVGLLVFMLVKKALSGGKKLPRQLPGMSLSIFLFGIIALVLIMLWNPINSALQDSSVGVGGAFVGILIVGVLVMFMGQKMMAKHAAA